MSIMANNVSILSLFNDDKPLHNFNHLSFNSSDTGSSHALADAHEFYIKILQLQCRFNNPNGSNDWLIPDSIVCFDTIISMDDSVKI